MLRSRLAAIAFVVGVVSVPPALAQTKVRIGQPQVGTFQFVPLQVGGEAGIFKKHGIDLEIISFGGGPRVQQALAAESIDIGIGSGPELAFVAKGAPEIGVAAMADAPYSVVLAVTRDSVIKTAEDLKGKIISISSKGSLTDWLGQELSRQLGWGSTGINLAPLGSTAAQAAALRTRQIDGMIVEANAGYRMEDRPADRPGREDAGQSPDRLRSDRLGGRAADRALGE
jgi:NitT/TauT family transport system substrate-binding protein